MKSYIAMALCIASLSVSAEDIRVETKDRSKILSMATVWKAPRADLTASDIFNGPKAKGWEELLTADKVHCVTSQEDQEGDFGGKTPKFYCQLLKPTSPTTYDLVTKKNGERRVIKVKYSSQGVQNDEIQGEILGTRLLWALGFYADQMFFVPSVRCFGCTADPYNNRQVVTQPGASRTFHNVAIESKIDGDKIVSPVKVSGPIHGGDNAIPKTPIWSAGVGFGEMMAKDNLPAIGRAEQKAQRDALRLLAVFMQHTDLKAENQRLVCKETDAQGKCTEAIMMIQDIGTSFGVTFDTGVMSLQKVDLNIWKKSSIWKDAKACEAQISESKKILFGLADKTMTSPVISEAGRQFLAKLLTDFSSDQSRVIALFKAARVSNVEAWVKAFNEKVEQIKSPTGNPNFKCPQ